MQQQQKRRAPLFLEKKNKQIKHKIALEQRNAIHSSANKNSIVIKEADKGGGIVIMHTDFYKRSDLEMLTDESYYQPVPYNTRNVMKEIRQN